MEIKVVGEGMPISKANSNVKKGDLIVKVEVEFPDRLTGEQMRKLKEILG